MNILVKVNKNKYLLINGIVLFFSLFSLLHTTPISAQNIQTGLNSSAQIVYQGTPNKINPHEIIGPIINVALGTVGLIFFILFTVGGLQWMFAQGNDEITKKAKSLMINASIGIIITFSAFAISTVLLDYVFKITTADSVPPTTE